MDESKAPKPNERLEFLAEKFDVFEEKEIKNKVSKLEAQGFTVEKIWASGLNPLLLAIVYYITQPDCKAPRNISVSLKVFSDMIASDPTANKSCVQWMLTTFARYLKEGGEGIASAIRFVDEDLPSANQYITLFEANKRKSKFKKLCKTSFILKHLLDPTDINQYKSLSQLYDAVDPFIEREPSALEGLLQRYVDGGQALIPVRDRKFTLYIPLTADASIVFNKFAGWCTARAENSMFSNYTNQATPIGNRSRLYIVINNDFFKGTSDDLFQIHFESKQIKNAQNADARAFDEIIRQSEGLGNFFHEELLVMAKACKKGWEDNLYFDYLQRFGFCDSCFEILEDERVDITLMKMKIPKLPDISKFKCLDALAICGAGLKELHESIGKIKNLTVLSLSDNEIKSIPKEIGLLKKLEFLNLVGNPIEYIPEEIKYLDIANGGSLVRLAINQDDIGEENFERLKKLLPTAVF